MVFCTFGMMFLYFFIFVLRLQRAKKLGWLFLAVGGRSSMREWQLTATLGGLRRHWVVVLWQVVWWWVVLSQVVWWVVLWWVLCDEVVWELRLPDEVVWWVVLWQVVWGWVVLSQVVWWWVVLSQVVWWVVLWWVRCDRRRRTGAGPGAGAEGVASAKRKTRTPHSDVGKTKASFTKNNRSQFCQTNFTIYLQTWTPIMSHLFFIFFHHYFIKNSKCCNRYFPPQTITIKHQKLFAKHKGHANSNDKFNHPSLPVPMPSLTNSQFISNYPTSKRRLPQNRLNKNGGIISHEGTIILPWMLIISIQLAILPKPFEKLTWVMLSFVELW